jgi:S1-C subfamily serine protease
VFRIGVRCEGTFRDSKNGKIYNVSAVAPLGSGAFISEDGFGVTNKHVEVVTQDKDFGRRIALNKLMEQISQQGDNKDAYLSSLASMSDLEELKTVNIKLTPIVILPNGEEMPFKTVVSGAPVGEGKDVALIKVNVRNAPVLKLANSNEVKLAEYVMALGYPMSGDSAFLNEKSSNIVSITDGIVSAKKKLKDGSSVIQISAPAYYGSSGGPVVNNRGEIVGLVTFGGNDAVSGFTFIVPSNTILEFVEQVRVNNQEGLVNQKYRQGLQLYAQGKYQQAMQKFQLVKRLFPHHSEVERLLDACQKEIASKN